MTYVLGQRPYTSGVLTIGHSDRRCKYWIQKTQLEVKGSVVNFMASSGVFCGLACSVVWRLSSSSVAFCFPKFFFHDLSLHSDKRPPKQSPYSCCSRPMIRLRGLWLGALRGPWPVQPMKTRGLWPIAKAGRTASCTFHSLPPWPCSRVSCICLALAVEVFIAFHSWQFHSNPNEAA